jgi:Domain of unknown function (DUF4111)
VDVSQAAADDGPTQFPELNLILQELTERARSILDDNFVGAYLQGSFAVGDPDIHSDCDFLIPVHRPITAGQETGLRALHDEFPARREHWAQHLEGSYPLASELRTLRGMGRNWLYIDHGWREMQWSTHCNTDVVRWSLRECGVTLAGPAPGTLVDKVPGAVLQARMRTYAEEFLPGMFTWIGFDIAWAQRYAVTTFCRILHTIETGRVTSKKAALLWARDNLDARWSALIQQVIDDRSRGWDPGEPPRTGSVEQTLIFADYAKARATDPQLRAAIVDRLNEGEHLFGPGQPRRPNDDQ